MPRVWGGRALEQLLGHELPTDQPYGETWDLCGLPESPSPVAVGLHRGKTLADLWRTHRIEMDPRSATMDSDFPLLIKWLDCRDWLSVQVHPDDSMARQVLKQPRGKSEVWIVLSAEPTARVYAGVRAGVSHQEFLQHLEAGSADECLHWFTPRAGDCIVLPAGTIHAAGGGLLIAEVQQSSDATFRLFDWNRPGLDGKPRPLQIELGLQAIDWQQGQISPVTPRLIDIRQQGVRGEVIAEFDAFNVERYRVAESWIAPHPGELTVWMVLDGAVKLTHNQSGEQRELLQGQSVLIPAAAGECVWNPAESGSSATLICVRLSQSSRRSNGQRPQPGLAAPS